jgi:hypothetical protein
MDWALAPHQIFDFFGVLLQHNEVKVVEVQKLANLRRESCSQFLRFAARGDSLADAHHSPIPVGIAFMRGNGICAHVSKYAETRLSLPRVIDPALNDDSLALRVAIAPFQDGPEEPY